MVPLGHFPMVFNDVYDWVTVVVPFPPAQVIFVVTVPASLLTGSVLVDDPPNPPVHPLKEAFVVPFAPVIVVVVVLFEHTTLDFSAADAGAANGIATRLPDATARTSALARTETFMHFPLDRRTIAETLLNLGAPYGAEHVELRPRSPHTSHAVIVWRPKRKHASPEAARIRPGPH